MLETYGTRTVVNFPYHSETGCALGKISWSGPYMRSPGQPMRQVDDLHLVYVTRGVCDFENEQGVRRLTPGDMMVLLPGMRHRYGAPPGYEWDERYIRCEGPLVDLWMREGIVSLTDTIWRVLPVDYWDGRMIDVIGDNFVPSPDESLAQLGRLQTLLGDMRMARRSGGTHADEQAWLHQARKLLDSRLTESRPDLYAAAAAMGCGYHTFRRRFVQLAGIGPAQYRLHSQINLAQALMIQHPSLSNKELAERCGFGDEFHFSKQFKRVTQLSPRQFREKCRAGRIGAVE